MAHAVNGQHGGGPVPGLMKPMFITVKYGDNQEAIFNPWCHCYILLECIRKKCKCDKNVTIDLVDTEGRISDLHTKNTEYATDYVIARETYILIQVEKNDGKPSKYTPLLHDLDIINPDLMCKLNSVSKITTSKHHRGQPRDTTGSPNSPTRRESTWGNVRKKISVTRALRGNVSPRKNSQSQDGRKSRSRSESK